jgi:hypothetical protein
VLFLHWPMRAAIAEDAYIRPSKAFNTKLIVMEIAVEKWMRAELRLKESARTAACMTEITTAMTAMTIMITTITITQEAMGIRMNTVAGIEHHPLRSLFPAAYRRRTIKTLRRSSQ